ncbi:MAG: CRISPR-associated protein [Muribaculaceae bacterium]|nr:CRISPR-associated protein [Muribaculaceae bacterium]
MKQHKTYPNRYIARVTVEAVTPIAVGSGEKDVISDALVIRDVNGLPYLPATSLAGVLRHAVDEAGSSSTLWGFQEGDKGCGSRIAFTNANLVDSNGRVVDGLTDVSADSLLRRYDLLPVRQHVRIGHDGTGENCYKFDNEVVYAGSRFTFEIELAYDNNQPESQAEAEGTIRDLRSTLSNDTMRLGSNVHSGLGLLRVVSWKETTLHLKEKDDLERYINKSSSLADDCFWQDVENECPDVNTDSDWTRYDITLTPDDTFMFGSGFGDDFKNIENEENEGADDTPVTESRVEWTKEGKGKMTERRLLIPASSVKGALRHRVAFHYNRLNKVYADSKSTDIGAVTGGRNKAIIALFGSDNATDKDGNETIVAGNVMISDVFDNQDYVEKEQASMLYHVSIDQFTGGAREGALYNEKVAYRPREEYKLTLWVKNEAFTGKVVRETIDNEFTGEYVRKALECALDDITKGMLPLGGNVNRGHGVFTGSWTCNKPEQK